MIIEARRPARRRLRVQHGLKAVMNSYCEIHSRYLKNHWGCATLRADNNFNLGDKHVSNA